MSTYYVKLITPLFSRGAYEDVPEIRPPSIRGMLHHWVRLLGGTRDDEKRIFGGVHQGASASKVVVRVANIEGQTARINTLPHKAGGQASPKAAFAAGTTFDLVISKRLGGLGRDEATLNRALEAWLLMGSLGLRSTRGAGSFTWSSEEDAAIQPPSGFDDYEERCRSVLASAKVRFALLETSYGDAEKARRVVSDTLGGRDDRQGQDDLARLHDPLGRVFNGRKTSPLKFRIVAAEDRFRIAALWDTRGEVTGNSHADLRGIIALLAERKPSLGQQLQKASW